MEGFMGVDKFGFAGKRAVVVGGASGIGLATGQLLDDLGATVLVADVKEPMAAVGDYRRLDLRHRADIDGCLVAFDKPVDALFMCAGVADGTEGLPQINFIGQRHLVEMALQRELLRDGSAVAMIASMAGTAWYKHLDTVGAFLDTPDFEAASEWMVANPKRANYTFCKQAVIAYVARRAPALLHLGVRLNCIAPGPTMTPLMASTDVWLGMERAFEQTMGRSGSSPEQQAHPLVFLNSDAASYISGTCLAVDLGYMAAGVAGTLDDPMLRMLLK
jgi:NAD(P)-dependent dehydrogenase (short-subunit alcohol dehydrogenase family)